MDETEGVRPGQRLLPIIRRVYNLGLDEFFTWYTQEARNGFTKAIVAAWRVALEARGLGAVSINVRIAAVRKLAVEAADNGLRAPELANGITRVKGVPSQGIRLANWLSPKQAQTLLNAPDATTPKGLRDRAILAILLGCGLRRSQVAALTMGHIQQRDGPGCNGCGWSLAKAKSTNSIPITGVMKRYPLRGNVSTYRGFRGSSSRAARGGLERSTSSGVKGCR